MKFHYRCIKCNAVAERLPTQKYSPPKYHCAECMIVWVGEYQE